MCRTVLLVLVALSALQVGPAAAGDTPLTGNAVADSTLDFGLDLYRVVKQGGKNVLLSPYSITTALSMARAGAAGETARQMDRVLHLSDATPATAHGLLRKALSPPKVEDPGGASVPAYQLQIANALWLSRDLEGVKREYLAQLSGPFGAPAERIDFRNITAACERINGWVEDRTCGRIRNMVAANAIEPDTRMVLANAIFFKAAWMQPFEKKSSREGPFQRAAGTAVSAHFMHRSALFDYTENDEAQVIELPYRADRIGMVVILPRERGGLQALEESLTAEKVRGWLQAMSRERVEVALPRFKFATPFDLGAKLEGLGMKDAFGTQADFSGITAAEPLAISRVLHKAFIAVDEAGTEATAATMIIHRSAGLPPAARISFTANRPFLLLIRQRKTGAILFVGCVEDPSTR